MHVYLRALEPEDYKISVKWRNDDEINGMIGGPKYFVSSEYEKRWVENRILNNNTDIALAVCIKENNQYIGNVYLNDINWINKRGESAILIGEQNHWGKGFAFEALVLLLKFAFYERGLNRVSAHVLESNKASLRLHEKCGYQKEGLLRYSVYKNGKFENQFILSILRSEFDKLIKTENIEW